MGAWEVLTCIWRLHRSVLREATPCLERHGLFPMAPLVLSRVETHPSPTELACALGVQPPTVSHVLRRLEQAGYVQRESDPADLRRFRFRLTPAGRDALEAARRCLQEAMERRIARLTVAERALLLSLLRAMLDPDEGAMRPWTGNGDGP